MSKILLTSSDYIKSNFEIQDNFEDSRILSAIRKSQDIELQQAIGSSLLSKIQSLINAGTIGQSSNSYYKTLLDDYIQPYLGYLVVAELCFVGGQRISNAGIVTATDEHIQTMELDDRMQLRDYYLQIADSYLEHLQRYVIAENSHFPELNADDTLKIQANLNSSASCGIWLGGKRNPSSKYPGRGNGWCASDILWSDE